MRVRNRQSNKTYVHILLDKSGSMDPNRRATVDAINEYIGKLKKDGNKYNFSLTFFDTELEKPYENVDIQSVGKLTEDLYRPDGMTALLDAVHQTVSDTEELLKSGTKYAGDKVLFVIMTDGMENASHEYNRTQVANLIKRLQEKEWTFIFLGANQDSWATAQNWGISSMNISNFNATNNGLRCAFNMMASATKGYSAGTSDPLAMFSTADQQKLQETK
jgi:uncharacterized protein with von Willebrand factor type A (vWA) domain